MLWTLQLKSCCDFVFCGVCFCAFIQFRFPLYNISFTQKIILKRKRKRRRPLVYLFLYYSLKFGCLECQQHEFHQCWGYPLEQLQSTKKLEHSCIFRKRCEFVALLGSSNYSQSNTYTQRRSEPAKIHSFHIIKLRNYYYYYFFKIEEIFFYQLYSYHHIKKKKIIYLYGLNRFVSK